MNGFVYCITNTVNGKRYVGQTMHTLKRRWTWHAIAARNGSGLPIHKAIRKHGTQNFTIEAIAECDSAKSMDAVEREQIIALQAHVSTRKGYNVTWGGDAVGSGADHPWFGRHHTKNAKDRIRLAKLGEHNPQFGLRGSRSHNFGLIRSPETKAKIREAVRKQVPPRLGISPSEAHREKIRQALLRQVTPDFREKQRIFGRHAWHLKRGRRDQTCPLCAA